MSIPFDFTPVPKYFRKVGWIKDPKTTALIVWGFNRCNSQSREIVFDQTQVLLPPFAFVFGRRQCAEDTGLTEHEVRCRIKNLIKSGLLEKIASKSTNKFTVYKWVTDRFGTISNQQKTHQTASKRPGKRHNQEPKRTKDKRTFSQECYDLSHLLFKSILQVQPKMKTPNFNSWALHIDRALRLDNRSIKDIECTIAWLPTDGFWSTVIFSTKTLRKNFDALLVQKQKTMRNKNQTNKHVNKKNKRSLPESRKFDFS